MLYTQDRTQHGTVLSFNNEAALYEQIQNLIEATRTAQQTESEGRARTSVDETIYDFSIYIILEISNSVKILYMYN